MANDPSVVILLPYFQQYLDRGFFPDGRGMLYQPVALLSAFEVFVSVFRKFEFEDMEKRMKNGK